MDTAETYRFFAGSSHPLLAGEVVAQIGGRLGELRLGAFPDQEIYVEIMENVRGRDIFLLQSIVGRPNDYLIELLALVDGCKRASAGSNLVALLPYYGYARQDRKDRGRVPITAKLVADLLERAGVSHVVTIDLHAEQIQGFFDCPVDNLYAYSLLCDALLAHGLKDILVVCPDIGSVKIAHAYADRLGCDFAIIDKRRHSPTEVEVAKLLGEVRGKDVLLTDDLIATGGTLLEAAQVCQRGGARSISVAATHGLFLGDALQKLVEGPIDHFFLANTVPGIEKLAAERFPQSMHVTSVAPLLAQAVEAILTGESIASLRR